LRAFKRAIRKRLQQLKEAAVKWQAAGTPVQAGASALGSAVAEFIWEKL